jgi:hypothetical protein
MNGREAAVFHLWDAHLILEDLTDWRIIQLEQVRSWQTHWSSMVCPASPSFWCLALFVLELCALPIKRVCFLRLVQLGSAAHTGD